MVKGIRVPRTPQKKRAKSSTPDTPSRLLKIHNEEADADLDSSRRANADDLGPDVPIIPVKDFFKRYIPGLKRGITIAKISNHLQATGVLTDEGWRDFSNMPKDQKGVHEDICFSTLKKVVEGIVEAGKSQKPNASSMTFACIPNLKPIATVRESTNRPDCAILLRLEGDRPYWDDIAVSGEFKKDDNNVDHSNRLCAYYSSLLTDRLTVCQNTEQLLWDLNQTMRNDPCRRFTLGFTIENTEMRIWHADRSDVVVSEAFDFHDGCKFVIKFFAGIMFAEPVQLGWDPTMKRIRVGDTDQFDITVRVTKRKQRIYRTVSMLSGMKADALRGRATRVWECVEVDKSGREIGQNPVVLKDTWIDHDREREGSIIEKLRNVNDHRFQTVFQDVLLTVECHGDVYVDSGVDRTDIASGGPSLDRFTLRQAKPNQERRKAQAAAARKAVFSPIGGPGKTPKQAISYHRKVHYRCVFKELGTPLDEITSLVTVYKVLGEVAEGLHALHTCGYVHRDLTSANIIVVNSSGKITDLEYVKRFDSNVSHNVRSGISYFVPIEIIEGHPLFEPSCDETRTPSPPPNLGFTKFTDFYVITKGRFRRRPKLDRDNEVLVYLPIHDMESLWWIGVYFVVNREVVKVGVADPGEVPKQRSDNHKALASNLFYTHEARRQALIFNTWFTSRVEESFHPAVIVAGEQLESIRRLLAAVYEKAEKNVGSMTFFNTGDKLHVPFQSHFFTIARKLNSMGDVTVSRYDRLTGAKRKAEDADLQPTAQASKVRHVV